jgi:hypothetical protein
MKKSFFGSFSGAATWLAPSKKELLAFLPLA